MKNLIVTLFLMILVIPLHSQGDDGLIFIADGIAMGQKHYEYTSSGEFDYDWVFEDYTDVVVPIKLGVGFIAIESKDKLRYEIVKTEDPMKMVDDEGDTYTAFVFQCLDNDDDRLRIVFQTWDDYEVVRMFMFYGNFAVRYKGYLQE